MTKLHGRLSLLAAVFGIFGAMAFMVDATSAAFVAPSAVPPASTDYGWGALAAALAVLFYAAYLPRENRRFFWSAAVAGLAFGVLNYFGVTLFYFDTWNFIFAGKLQLLKALLQVLGQAAVMYTAVVLIGERLKRSRTVPAKGSQSNRLLCAFEQKPFWVSLLFLLLCWLPWLICYFPGSVDWDMGHMIGQFFGVYQRDTWHPVLTMFISGGCVWLGRLLGSDALGIFLFTLLQASVTAVAYALSIACVRRMGAPRWLQIGTLLFFGFVPLFASFAQMVGKDTLYIGVLTLFALQTTMAVRDAKRWMGRGRQYLGYAATTVLVCLLRTNGIYVALPTALLVFSFIWRGKARAVGGLSLACAFAVVLCFNRVLLPALQIPDATTSGIYSICFQSTARYLRDHGDEVTPEEWAELDAVLKAEGLAEKYEPLISDPVKFEYRYFGQGPAIEKPILQRYLKTWLSMGKKHPETYLASFVGGNSGYYAFTPKIEAEVYNGQPGARLQFGTQYVSDDERLLHTEMIPALEKARTLLAIYSRGWRHLPGLSLLYTCPFYTWLLVALFMACVRAKKRRALVAFAPAVLTLGVCCLSPVNDLFRYFMPMVAMTPTLLTFTRQTIMPADTRKE